MKIRDVGGLFEDALALYRSNWKLLLSIALVSGVAQAVLQFLVEKNKGDMHVLMPVLLVLVVAVIVLAVLSNVALILAVSEPTRYSGVMDAYQASTKFFLPMLWVGLLVFLAVLGGCILLIIPGIIFAIWFVFSQYILVLEDKRGVAALKTSRAYVSGNWWGVFLRLMVLVIAYVVLGFIIGLVTGMVALGDKAVATGLSSLIVATLTPFSIAYLYLMYKDLSAQAAAPIAEVVPTAPQPIA